MGKEWAADREAKVCAADTEIGFPLEEEWSSVGEPGEAGQKFKEKVTMSTLRKLPRLSQDLGIAGSRLVCPNKGAAPHFSLFEAIEFLALKLLTCYGR